MQRVAIAATLAAIGGAMMLGSAAWSAQPAATDPWTAVPAAPAGCYQNQDQYADKVQAAIDSVSDAESKQKAINQEIDGQVSDATSQDPMVMARRMQEALMRDPQNAAKVMQQMTAGASVSGAEAVSEEAARMRDRDAQLQAEGKQLEGKYKSALRTALAPARARYLELAKRADPQSIRGEGGDVWPVWAIKELDGILGEADRAYATTCPQWFGANGQLRAYLARYKEFLINERVPYYQRTIDEPKLTHYRMLNVPAAGYRSTQPHEAVYDYLKAAGSIYSQRQYRASCSESPCGDQLGITRRDR